MTNNLNSKRYHFLRFAVFVWLLLVPVTLWAQHGNVSLDLQNEEVSRFIRQVEKQTSYTFVYRNTVLNPKTRVSIVCTNWSVEKALSYVFSPLGIQFSFNNNTIVLNPAPASKEKAEPSVAKKAKPAGEKAQTTPEKHKVMGLVKEANGEPIIGASVFVKGTKIGTVTNTDGEFSLDVPANGTLLVSYIGFTTQEVALKGSANLNIVLKEDEAQALNEVVVVGYGTQKKATVTGAIASVSTKDLVQTPQANISNMLVGKMPGLIAMQRSGAPGEDNSTLLIRGVSTFSDNTAPLVMIDGVERPNYNGLDPNEIESVSILKDASATAIYGVRGANGVILITTRKGQKGKPHLSYSGNMAVQSPTALPHYLNSAQYCEMYNEALKNDAYTKGTSYVPRFTEQDIQLYRDGSDPIMHPSTDWVGTFLRKTSLRTQHNFNISGGTDRVKYFISAGFFSQGGMYKYTKIDRDHDVNASDTRYNFRSNLDFDVTQDFKATVQLSAQINNIHTPGIGNSELWKEISWATPLGTPGMVDGKLVRLENTIDDENPWQALLNNGYNDIFANTINTTLRFDYDLSRLLLKGLSVHASTSYDSYYNSKRFSVKTMQTFVPKRDPSDPTQVILVPQNESSTWGGGFSYNKNRKVYFEVGLHYNQTFGKHNTTALLLYNQSKYYAPSLAYLVPNAYQGIVGRVTYSYANRYLAEFNMGYNGTENFAPGRRFGFFPAVSVGWIVSEEPFFPKNDWLVYMKLRGTYGEVGNDKIGGDRFLYLPSVYGETSGNLSGYNFGSSSNPYYSQMIEERRLGNPLLTWEKARKLNLGIDVNLLKNHLTVSFDYFKERRNNILSNRNTAPMLIGATLPAYNMGEMENSGFELDVNYRNNIRDFNYWGRFNYSFARNKILFQDEVPEKYAYQMRTGRRVGQFYGLLFDGFYNTWEEINALDRPVSSWNGNRLQPGDMRYVDVNKDGKIDMYDMVPIGYSPTPEIIYGFSFGCNWRGFDFSALFQGADHVSIKYFGRALWPFVVGHNSAKTLILDRWTQERYDNGESINFPRLSMSPSRDTDNNYQDSNFWIRNANYLRLKNIELGYTFNRKQLKALGLESLRLYISGTNLFTWTDVIDLDPEAPSKGGATEINTYPLQKIYNIGLNIQF